MPKLTDDDRKARDLKKDQEKQASARAYWAGLMAETQSQMAAAAVRWEEQLHAKKLDMRDLWLILAIFETEETLYSLGKSKSCKSQWFDHSAPAARKTVNLRGISGFTSRGGRRAPEFIHTTGNGYVGLTKLGYALVQHLRQKHPLLHPTVKLGNVYVPFEVQGLGAVPGPVWRLWNWTN